MHQAAILAMAALLMAGGAHAQDNYPSQTVKIVIPSAPGSTTDILARLRDGGLAIAADRDNWHIPPMDTLFLQRKIGGIFLLATRMKARVPIRDLVNGFYKYIPSASDQIIDDAQMIPSRSGRPRCLRQPCGGFGGRAWINTRKAKRRPKCRSQTSGQTKIT